MSLVAIRTPQQVQSMRDQEQATRIANQNAPFEQNAIVDALAAKVRQDWNVAKQVKQTVTHRLMNCLERRQGRYGTKKLAEIEQTGGSAIYMQLTGAKCRAAKAYLSDLYTPAGDRPFTLSPTPVPELPPALRRQLMVEATAVIQQTAISQEDAVALLQKHQDRLLLELQEQAQERAEKMADVIEDQLVDAGWRSEFDAFLDDLVTYPAAIMKGPVFTHKKQIQWVEIPETGQFEPQRTRKIVPEVRRVSPFNSFPSPGIQDRFEGHWHIERRQFTFEELSNARGAPGYNSQAIAHVLTEYRSGSLTEWLWSEAEHTHLTKGQNSVYGKRETIDALEWTGTLQGKRLVDWGMDYRAVEDLLEEYPVSILVVGNYAIRALINPDPAGKPDYFKACWETVPGAFWGKALPETMADCQDMCNAAARSLSNNLGIASGPQVFVDMSRVNDGADVQSIYPWKVWYMKSGMNPGASSRDPIGFFQPDSHATELMAVYEKFSRYADEITGMPAFAYGSDQGAGAAKTASGLSMLLNASSKTIKAVVHTIDINVIEKVVAKFFNYNMRFHPDRSIKGDAVPKARGSESLIHKEQAQLRAQELLGITANPVDSQIMGLDGRRELLHEVFNTGDMPVDRMLPTREQLAERPNQQAEQQSQEAPVEAE